MKDSHDSSGFVLLAEVVPEILLDIRYYSTFNFVGERIDGYEEPVALLTWEAAEALQRVKRTAEEQGYRLKVFDAYRPQKAVMHFYEVGTGSGGYTDEGLLLSGPGKNPADPAGVYCRKIRT